MKKLNLLLLPLIATGLCSCVTSHYTSLILIEENTRNKSSIQFEQFEGQYVAKLKKTSTGEGCLVYSASLGSGKITVSYQISSIASKEEQTLFTIIDGETKEGTFGYVEKGYKATIIIKSDGKANKGKFSFTFSN